MQAVSQSFPLPTVGFPATRSDDIFADIITTLLALTGFCCRFHAVDVSYRILSIRERHDDRNSSLFPSHPTEAHRRPHAPVPTKILPTSAGLTDVNPHLLNE